MDDCRLVMKYFLFQILIQAFKIFAIKVKFRIFSYARLHILYLRSFLFFLEAWFLGLMFLVAVDILEHRHRQVLFHQLLEEHCMNQKPSSYCICTHCNNIFWFCHLVVNHYKMRGHITCNRSLDHYKITLP